MSFIGNFAAAKASASIGQYQTDIYDNEAKYIRANRDQKEKVYDEVLKPQLLDIHKTQYSDFFVSQLSTGAEIRPGTTPYFNLLKFKVAMSDEFKFRNITLILGFAFNWSIIFFQ